MHPMGKVVSSSQLLLKIVFSLPIRFRYPLPFRASVQAHTAVEGGGIFAANL